MIRKLATVCAISAALSFHLVHAAGVAENAKVLAQLDDEWSKAAGERDAVKVATFYADDAIPYPPGMPLAIGRASAQRVWANYFLNATFKISWKTDHAEISGDVGYTAGAFEDSYKGPDGKRVTETGKYVCVWKQ